MTRRDKYSQTKYHMREFRADQGLYSRKGHYDPQRLPGLTHPLAWRLSSRRKRCDQRELLPRFSSLSPPDVFHPPLSYRHYTRMNGEILSAPEGVHLSTAPGQVSFMGRLSWSVGRDTAFWVDEITQLRKTLTRRKRRDD